MATETVASDHSANPEEIEKTVQGEEEKAIVKDINEEEKTLKAEDSAARPVVPLSESEEKTDDEGKKIEPQGEELNKTIVVAEKTKAEDSLAVPSVSSDKMIEDEKTEVVAVQEVNNNKIEDVETEDSTSVPAAESEEKAESEDNNIRTEEVSNSKPETPTDSESAADDVTNHPEKQSAIETVEEQPKGESAADSVPERESEQPQDDVPESLATVFRIKKEQIEDFPVKESAAVKEVEREAAESQREENPEILHVVEEEAPEQFEVIKEGEEESIAASFQEAEVKEVEEEEGASDNVEDSKEITLMNEGSDHTTSSNQEEHKDKELDSPPVDVTTTENLKAKEKELSGLSGFKNPPEHEIMETGKQKTENEIKYSNVEGVEKAAVMEETSLTETKFVDDVYSSTEVKSSCLEAENVSMDIEHKDAKVEEDGEKKVVIEESKQPENISEDMKSSIPAIEVIGKALKEERTSKDIEPKNGNAEVAGEKKVIIDESEDIEAKIGEDVSISIPTTEVTEKVLEEENISQDVQPKEANVEEDGDKNIAIEESKDFKAKIAEDVSSSIPSIDISERALEGVTTSRDVEPKDANIEDGVEKKAVIEESKDIQTKIAEDASSSIPSNDEVAERALQGESVSEEKDEKIQEDGEKMVVIEESNQPKTKSDEYLGSFILTNEVTEKALVVENISRDIELVAENGKENAEEGAVASLETNKDAEVESKVTRALTGVVEELKDSSADIKDEKTLQTGETEQEKGKEVGKTGKPDIPNPDSKDKDDTKATQDPPKEAISGKSIPKQSHNIIKKVKQSLVKAKKAIIGKSSNTRTQSSENKGDEKVK